MFNSFNGPEKYIYGYVPIQIFKKKLCTICLRILYLTNIINILYRHLHKKTIEMLENNYVNVFSENFR